MRDFNDQARPPPDHQKELVKLIIGLAPRHSPWQVFADFAEMASVSISNAVDRAQRDRREERYMEIVKRYKPDELARFPEMLVALTMALEEEPEDVLGRTFHDLELHNKWAGQYFTPYHICRMTAKMTIGNTAELEARIAEVGFVTAQEPAVGSGAMVIALAHEMRDAGINYQQHLHVTAVDVDAKCVHMAYLQFALLHIPAGIVHGDSLSREEFAYWHSPAHILGEWNRKLRQTNIAPAREVRRVEIPPRAEPIKGSSEEDDPGKPPSQLTLF